MNHMIDAASKPRHTFSDKPSGLVPYIAASTMALAALFSAFWFVAS